MIRTLQASDMPRLKELQAISGIVWSLPDPSELLSARVLVDEQDQVILFLGAIKCAEIVCITDPQWETPQLRAAALEATYKAVEQDLRATGTQQWVAWLAPKVAKSFYRRLKRRFGWEQSKWLPVSGYIK